MATTTDLSPAALDRATRAAASLHARLTRTKGADAPETIAARQEVRTLAVMRRAAVLAQDADPLTDDGLRRVRAVLAPVLDRVAG